MSLLGWNEDFADGQRLEDAIAANGVGEAGDGILVEGGAGLAAVGNDIVDGELQNGTLCGELLFFF